VVTQSSRLKECRRWKSGKYSVNRELGPFQMFKELRGQTVVWHVDWRRTRTIPPSARRTVHIPKNSGRNPGECLPVCLPYVANSTNKPKQGPIYPIHPTAMCLGLTFRLTRRTMYYNLPFTARSSNNCCSGKAISITYSECVFVALVVQHVKGMRHIVILGVSGPIVFFPIISNKREDFRTNVIEHKIRILGFSKILSETFLILR
jgi:hypothetical protein